MFLISYGTEICHPELSVFGLGWVSEGAPVLKMPLVWLGDLTVGKYGKYEK